MTRPASRNSPRPGAASARGRQWLLVAMGAAPAALKLLGHWPTLLAEAIIATALAAGISLALLSLPSPDRRTLLVLQGIATETMAGLWAGLFLVFGVRCALQDGLPVAPAAGAVLACLGLAMMILNAATITGRSGPGWDRFGRIAAWLSALALGALALVRRAWEP